MKKLFLKKRIRAFTLVEMLIVIVIIGILAAALIPRLASARGRANDTARKADLQQVANGLVAYQIDHGAFPAAQADPSLSAISGSLISAGLSSIPHDPNTARTFSGVTAATTAGQYAYTTIYKGGVAANGFVLMAGSETAGGANWIYTGTLTSSSTFESITPCTSIVEAAVNANNGGTCTYIKGQDVLRYIYVY